ncbi:histone-fold-containing protein, partial [Nadsonia fulvescens var. elongata DSM 6958]
DSVDFEQQHNNNIEEETVTDQNTAAEITNADEQDQAELVDTGHGISLPIARIKRIIKQDDDVVQCSSAATVAIAAATELFVQYFAEQAMIMARGEKRKKLNYSDFATAVVKIDQLEFLSDLVPRTTTLRKLVREKKV